MKDWVFVCDLGEFVLEADNGPLGGRPWNRRPEIILIPKLDELYEALGGEGAK